MLTGGREGEAAAWAVRMVRAYAAAAPETLGADDQAALTLALRASMAECIGLALPPASWSGEYVDAALARWEAASGRMPGPRLIHVDVGAGVAVMG